MKTARPALIIAFGAALDLAAKLWARTSLEPYGAATDFLPFVALRLTFNQGVSFSLFSFEGETARLVLLLATAALTASFALWAFNQNQPPENPARFSEHRAKLPFASRNYLVRVFPTFPVRALLIRRVAKPSVLFTLDDLMSSEGQSRVGAARPAAGR